MPTPSIQTLRADAQQVLNLDSISAVRSVVAATLANANAGTPLNPNLTTQQLWNEFYQIVTQPKSDIESIIANQLMKFLYAPPAPGGAGADKQVIFNDGGVLAGDPQFLWNKTTNLLTVTGSATITGDLTVDTNVLKVDSAGNRVSVNTTTFATDSAFAVKTTAGKFDVRAAGSLSVKLNSDQSMLYNVPTGNAHLFQINDSDAMTLNATGLGVGVTPAAGDGSGAFKAAGTGSLTANSRVGLDVRELVSGNGAGILLGAMTTENTAVIGARTASGNIAFQTFNGSAWGERMRIDYVGNVGIGVTPSAWGTGIKGLDIGAWTSTAQIGAASFYGFNSYASTTGQFNYKNSGAIALGYFQTTSGHLWLNAPSNAGAAGANASFTTVMTLDTNGNLILLSSNTPATLTTNGQLTVNATSNTNLRFSYRGSDGVTRTANLTLA